MGEIDWFTAGIEDKAIADGLESCPETEPRFETPKNFVPVIPPVKKDTRYNAFDSYTAEEWRELMETPWYLRP